MESGSYTTNLPSWGNPHSNGAEIFIQMRRIEERERERERERGRSVPKSNGALSPSFSPSDGLRMCISASAACRPPDSKDIVTIKGTFVTSTWYADSVNRNNKKRRKKVNDRGVP